MNFYKRHLGDYAKDTGHLSALEHGVYTLLLDHYYSTEAGIPAERAYRVARARSATERAAVDAVLGEFFTLVDLTWRNRRADAEIAAADSLISAARANGKRGGRPSKAASGKPEPPVPETPEKPSGFSGGSQNGTPNKASQTPDSRLQKKPSASAAPCTNPADPPAQADGLQGKAGQLSLEMRRHGVVAQPADPRIIALAEAGVSAETVAAACAEARASKSASERIAVGYVTAILRRWIEDPGAAVPVARGSQAEAAMVLAAERGVAP